MRNNPCFLYVMTDEMGFFKIGISSDPEARLSSIQTGNPRNLLLVATWRADNELSAKRMEKRLHLGAGRHRTKGEWFFSRSHEAVLVYASRVIGRNPGEDKAPSRLPWLYDHRAPSPLELAVF